MPRVARTSGRSHVEEKGRGAPEKQQNRQSETPQQAKAGRAGYFIEQAQDNSAVEAVPQGVPECAPAVRDQLLFRAYGEAIRLHQKVAPMPDFGFPFAAPGETAVGRKNPARDAQNEIRPPQELFWWIRVQRLPLAAVAFPKRCGVGRAVHSVELPCSMILCPREFEGFAGKPLVGNFLGLAFGHEVVLLETANSRGNCVTRKRGAIQDVEAEKERRVVRQFRVRHNYVGI